ncbi:MAG: phosphomannomutase [candidate division FCPU426 bacterium]
MLQFGTSGLRGLVTDMTDQECYVNTLGFVRYLLDTRQAKTGQAVCLAGDLRSSTDRILSAVAGAVADAGCKVVFGGKVPSPAIMYYAMQHGQASIMVTGSHIPDDRNGIKFNKPGGEVLKDDEGGILAQVAGARTGIPEGLFDASGAYAADRRPKLPETNPQIEAFYRARYLSAWPEKALEGLRILVHQHSAVGRDLLVHILQGLGAEVVALGRSERFVPVDTENVNADQLATFREWVRHHHPHAIVSTDGDSDRPLVVDETGAFHRGDVLGAAVARFLGIRFAAVPVSANDAIDAYLQQAGIERASTRIGSPYVLAALHHARQAGKQPVAGWEVNGGFMLGTDLHLGPDRLLAALPTRDALLPILCVLMAAKQRGSLQAVFRDFPPRFTQAGLLDNFPQDISRRLIAGLQPPDSQVNQIDFQAQRLHYVFSDGHEEGRSAAYLAEAPIVPRAFWKENQAEHPEWSIKRLLEKYYFTAEKGFAPVARINVVDGIRITFENHDVAHIRPSGNAPQLRIYATANTQERADEIVRLGLAVDGILQAMSADIA